MGVDMFKYIARVLLREELESRYNQGYTAAKLEARKIEKENNFLNQEIFTCRQEVQDLKTKLKT
jgi:hypothetical protein